MFFKCERCGYVTTIKCNFIAHLQRKVSCEPLLSTMLCQEQLDSMQVEKICFKCKHCSKLFATSSNRVRHERHACKSADSPASLTASVLEKLHEVQEELKSLKRDTLRPNITFINNNNITLNAFEYEKFDHIKSNKMFLTRCLMYKNMTGLLEKMYFDDTHPENHNVKVPNKKQPYIQYYDGDGWKYEQKDDVLDKMVTNGKNLLDEHFIYNEDEIKQFVGKLFDQIVSWMEDIKRNKKTVQDLKEKAYLMLLSHKHAK